MMPSWALIVFSKIFSCFIFVDETISNREFIDVWKRIGDIGGLVGIEKDVFALYGKARGQRL